MLGLRRLTATALPISNISSRAFSSIKFKNVTIDGEYVLTDVSFYSEKGEKIALMGNSEIGKSTFLKLLNGSVSPTRGEINFMEGNRVLTFQSAIPSDASMCTINSFLTRNVANPSGLNKDTIDKILRDVKLSDVRPGRTVSTLSLSQQARLQMAAMLLQQPDIILFDHPTDVSTGLSHDDVEDLKNFISQSPTTCVIHSNDEDFMDSVSTSVLHFDEDVSVGERTVYLIDSPYREAKAAVEEAKVRDAESKAEKVRQEKLEALRHSRSPDVVAELDRIGFENLESARSQEQYIQAMLLIMIMHPPAAVLLYNFGFLDAIM
mmetsp:Transcript_12479/g.18858  ORF Transcript_12479/g.18858 Transcript_12479/m.18858 type:complete len:321 (+) Transcript_12479:125-1087(+)|eukprot:CAMPEP_0185030970 /NCGR_PEP_ID=MMETSP1103-20130426/18145_1 /TAXON_ID=36769 /ORGANISM="Paraphysomonas bandaiensis, Strain Caron Lab Isolate" /LENGTH=320 /DNA_ID=CAMNT_0027566291 /DNA_START=24 /DNA_END=986 /DNA_ORIENTATION=+